MSMIRRHRMVRPNSFSLVELLVVLAIMAILAAVATPAITGLMRSSSLTAGGNRLVDYLNLSRQAAMAKNCRVEFRMYQLPDPTVPSSSAPTVYRAFQSFSLENNGSQTNAISKVSFLPDGIAMVNNATVSSLLPATPSNPPYLVSGATAGYTVVNYPPSSYNYMAFHFKPDGSTNLNPNSTSSWFVSLANQRDSIQGTNALPNNSYTVQIDAQTGRVRSFRPN